MKTNYRNVTLLGGFFKEKEDLNRAVTLDAVYDRFAESGRIAAFSCNWKEGMPNRPHFFWDSDVAKWMEGAAYVLSREQDTDLQSKVEHLIDEIEKNQGEDGYFNIYFTVCEPDKRFSNRDWHELYCAGHLMEAAVAYYEATGRDRFLRLMEKYADYIEKVFVREKSAPYETPGHEEIELALYRMYTCTGKTKYLDLMKHFLERRGQEDNHEAQIFHAARYAQSHLPIRRQKEAFGHSVRAMYLYAGMADLARETGDRELLDACRSLFDDVTKKKMYITGGIGSTCMGEAFTAAYDLPNNTAYTETCASIGMMFFANRLFQADPTRDSRYDDAVELEFFNGAISGLSLDGECFFYENPLEIYLAERRRIISTNDRERFPITQRPKIFGCSCCPPNIVRLLASLGEYIYAYDETRDTVYIRQFAESVYNDGKHTVKVQTAYPEDGVIRIESDCAFAVRMPKWCQAFKADALYRAENGYAYFEKGTVTLTLDMTPCLVTSRLGVVRNIGKAAYRRGPIVYCAEGVDNQDIQTLYFDKTANRAATAMKDDLLGICLTVKGYRRLETVADGLYAPLDEAFAPCEIRLIPYASFANRGESDMAVYLMYR
ncbi:MAG: glycoside hydrolase family 127 protein [Clostridia bacterium]|nr:glycoside hydrolase family 127 protein [Clostridia bacterium]